MKHPFRDDGPLDLALGFSGLMATIGLLVNELRGHPHGASWGWDALAGGMLVLMLDSLYRRFRARRPKKGD